MEETRNLTGNYAAKAAQSSLLRSVYVWMALALVITGLVALYVSRSYQLLSFIVENKAAFWVLLIAELAIVWSLSARIQKIAFSTATIMFIIYSILNGALFSVLFLIYTASSIASTFFITAGTFGVMAIYGYVTKTDLTRIGNICLMAIIGLIIASLVNVFWQNSMMELIVSGAGVLIFVGLTAYDSQKIKRLLSADGIKVNDETQKIALLGALSLYLDFINLFLYLLRFLGDRK